MFLFQFLRNLAKWLNHFMPFHVIWSCPAVMIRVYPWFLLFLEFLQSVFSVVVFCKYGKNILSNVLVCDFCVGLWMYFTGKLQVIGFWSETLHSPHWPPLSVNKGGMQSENNELSKSSLCVISGLKRFGNRFTPQTECWFLMWFFFFPPVVWVGPLLAGNYSLCAAVEGSPGPGFGSEATVQHQSNCNTHSRMTIWAQLLSIIIVEFRGDKKKRRY